jgi:hypothetical protein
MMSDPNSASTKTKISYQNTKKQKTKKQKNKKTKKILLLGVGLHIDTTYDQQKDDCCQA